jgi:tRNA(Arg) A34 adenosine deaminase TadA
MARAIELSVANVRSGSGGPFGTVIVKDGVILAEAANQVTASNDPTAHAEVLAIRDACQKLGLFELKGCDLYTSCEPCPMCLGAIYWARIHRVYLAGWRGRPWRVDDSAITTDHAAARGARDPMIQMMRDEALVAFRAWEENPGKIRY